MNIKEVEKDTKYHPYFKNIKGVHESGYGLFETGYCQVKDGKAFKIIRLGSDTDHIWSRGIDKEFDLSFDVTTNGYIRAYVFGHRGILRWEAPFSMSTMILVLKKL